MSYEEIQQISDDNSARAFSQNLMAKLKLENRAAGVNLAQGLWVHHRLRALELNVTEELAQMLPGSGLSDLVGVTVTVDLLNLVIPGDLECAYAALLSCIPDDGSKEYHWLTQERINRIRHEIGVFLGWE